MASRHRFDLVDSSYAMGLMAHRTPAWTEPYVAVLDQLVERHTGRWSAADRSTEFGHDPRRTEASQRDRFLVSPQSFDGDDASGWTANGVEPSGIRVDQAAADGMLSDTGFLLVVLGVRSMIDPDDRWNRPFEMIGDGDRVTSTHSEIAEHLCRRWLAAPIPRHGENSEVWPFRLAAAGLGLKLHDNRYGTDLHRQAFVPWWSHAREHHLALSVAFLAAPQEPADARRLFDAGCTAIGLDGDMPLPVAQGRDIASALILAREWGLDDIADRLASAVETSYEPTWAADRGEFTWGPHLDEVHLGGRNDAFLAAAEATGPGRWTRLSASPLEPCPQIVDVDFPTMAFTRAEWVDGNLRMRLAPLREDPRVFTSFRIVGAEPRNWDVHGMDGVSLDLTSTALNVRVPLIAGDLEFIRSSY